MKTAERHNVRPYRSSIEYGSTSAFHSSKIHHEHLEKLAIVYVRQSSPKQVLEHRESRERQYALVELAKALGWSAERVLVIDEDQGQSGKWADNRDGFQRLLSEVTMDHGGIVIGLEMSRLARSSKDWHHLFELCGIFDTLLADEDGVYDANDPTDRMVLGLKGLMSELELHVMRNRLHRNALNKARRGELFLSVPVGYIILPNDEVVLDPDEQARTVVQQIFDKFDELGTISSTFRWFARHNISLPMRVRGGSRKGELDWRRPTFNTIRSVLHNPIYAGAYAYGRCEFDRKSPYRSRQGKGKRVWKPMDEWKVLIKERLPAYITWDRFVKNQEQIRQNRQQNGSGAARNGSALLSKVLSCGNCNWKMQVAYDKQVPYYVCESHRFRGTERTCCKLSSVQIDDLVTHQVLRSLEPAALELSMNVLADVERERAQLDKHWQHRLQRAQYEIDLAERRYRAVDPDNRLVAATLEKQWEEMLCKQRAIQDEYDRFQRESPTQLTPDERSKITALSSDIPALWHAERTTNADRKEIIRCLIERVVVHVRSDTEYVDATIHWSGGYTSQHEFRRGVNSYTTLRDFDSLMSRAAELRAQGETTEEIAGRLNAEGFLPPKQREGFNARLVELLLKRAGLTGRERSHDELLGNDEWWLTDLSRNVPMCPDKLRAWTVRGWVHGRQTPIQKNWILWADDDELARLRALVAESGPGSGRTSYPPELTTPKARV
jgi:DNA invertase Pin-like site-specific DNA recombinase